jgi:hypothetical protein
VLDLHQQQQQRQQQQNSGYLFQHSVHVHRPAMAGPPIFQVPTCRRLASLFNKQQATTTVVARSPTPHKPPSLVASL